MAKNIKHFFAYETFKLLSRVYSIHLRLEVLNPTELHEEDSSRNTSDDLTIKKWTLTEARRLEDVEGCVALACGCTGSIQTVLHFWMGNLESLPSGQEPFQGS